MSMIELFVLDFRIFIEEKTNLNIDNIGRMANDNVFKCIPIFRPS